MGRADGSATEDLKETGQLSRAFSEVYKEDDHRPEPKVAERELDSPLAALAFTPEATRTVLDGVNPHKSAGPDDLHPSLVKILASVLAVPIAELFNRTLVDGSRRFRTDISPSKIIPGRKSYSAQFKRRKCLLKPHCRLQIDTKTIERNIHYSVPFHTF